MDTIIIHFEGYSTPQEVRVKAGTHVDFDDSTMILPRGRFVSFPAKLERWERVRGA